ncbi:hypothetical protein [Bacillus sp. AFS001701]|nr:hypothetical protein [Bacillus sp. AFS001701]
MAIGTIKMHTMIQVVTSVPKGIPFDTKLDTIKINDNIVSKGV